VANNSAIAYYITSHGYGHGVRSCCIIRAVNELHPGLAVQVVSMLPVGFLHNQIGSTRNDVRAMSFDVGMVQLDSIRVDLDATLVQAERIYGNRRILVEQEAAYLADSGIALVVADIPGIPLEAAARAGIPAVGVGNFGWDWIYSEFLPGNPRWAPIVEMFCEQYSLADLLLRLPFCEDMKAFARIEDIPLVARPGRARRDEIASLTGCSPEKKWILLSFTTLDWGNEALTQVEQIENYEFLTVLPLEWKRKNIYALRREQVTFADVVASVDAVVSKPGFGILSDCIVNRKPLIYADRSEFLEYPILEAAIRKYLKYVHIPVGQLYAGNLRDSLDRIWSSPEPVAKLQLGGDLVAANRIAGLVGKI
jgi:hypothetical protein